MPSRYQSWTTTQTLAEGLAEYYAVNPTFAGEADFLGQPRATVMAHDVCHVLLGLGPSSEEELIVETFTALGCSFPLREIIAFRKKAFAAELLRSFGVWRLVRRLVLSLPRVLRTVLVCLRMPRRWPHQEWHPYEDVPLSQLRRQFGLRPV
jgi:hypothetical protein